MLMASPNIVKTVEVCQVRPSTDAPEATKEFSLHLTYLDLLWIRFPPVERLYFFQLTGLTPSLFDSIILPKLKHSLSATLLYFIPLAGRLRWPPQSPKPLILYVPNDGVSFTVAESDGDFDHLSSNGIRDSSELQHYVPQLPVSESEASLIAMQITLFPNQGFSIGFAIHHTAVDGKSISMFMKAWAHLCKHKESGENYPRLLPEHIPAFDRTDLRDPSGLDMLVLKTWAAIAEVHLPSSKNPRSFMLLPHIGESNMVLSSFVLTREVINKLREKVLLSQVNGNSLHLSTFVLTCAYVLVCMAKSRGWEENRRVGFGFSLDFRTRLDPPLAINYFGNCVGGRTFVALARDFLQENSVSTIAERIRSMIEGAEKDRRPFEDIEELLSFLLKDKDEVPATIGVAGSTRFGHYGMDFGWGRPKKVEITSICKTGAISLTESRDRIGGIEIGLALMRHEMDVFTSLFVNGLKDL